MKLDKALKRERSKQKNRRIPQITSSVEEEGRKDALIKRQRKDKKRQQMDEGKDY